jgi:hypothetical protein
LSGSDTALFVLDGRGTSNWDKEAASRRCRNFCDDFMEKIEVELI